MGSHDPGTGTASPLGGGSGAAGGTPDVEMTFADVEKIGHDVAAVAEQATAAKSLLADARGHSAAFGSYPAARALYSHHQAVVNVFEDTLGAMTTDIDTFGHTIVQAAHAYEETDDSTQAALASIASRFDLHALQRHNVDARNQQGDKLDDVKPEELRDYEGDHPDLAGDVKQDVDQFLGGHDRTQGGFQGGDGG